MINIIGILSNTLLDASDSIEMILVQKTVISLEYLTKL